MWKHIKKCLGKFVQELKQIFRRRENNTPTQNNTTISKLSKEDEEILESLKAAIDMFSYKEDLIIDSRTGTVSPNLLADINKASEFSFNTYRTNLPKPIEFPCTGIVISSHFGKEYEAIIFDMSQYEEKKIAHIISYTPERIEEYFKGKEELTLEEVENQCMVALIPGGKVLYDEENDEWDYCFG